MHGTSAAQLQKTTRSSALTFLTTTKCTIYKHIEFAPHHQSATRPSTMRSPAIIVAVIGVWLLAHEPEPIQGRFGSMIRNVLAKLKPPPMAASFNPRHLFSRRISSTATQVQRQQRTQAAWIKNLKFGRFKRAISNSYRTNPVKRRIDLFRQRRRMAQTRRHNEKVLRRYVKITT